MNCSTVKRNLFFIILVVQFCTLMQAGCKRDMPEEEVHVEIFTEPKIETLPPLTKEYAAEVAERLIREQEDPEYIEALCVHARKDYVKAEALFAPLANKGNTMAMFFYAICLDINHGLGGYNKSREMLFRAAMEGNPYAMWDLNRVTAAGGIVGTISGQNWRERMIDYWFLRAEAYDLEASFCLSQALEYTAYFRGYAAYHGHIAALLSFSSKENFEKFKSAFEGNPEMPNWGEVVLGKLKKLADEGNPVAQCHYGTLADNEAYWEKSAENVYRRAMINISRKYTDQPGLSKKDALRGVYYIALTQLILGKDFKYNPYSGYLTYDNPNKGELPLRITEEEFNQITEGAQKWYDDKGQPAPYVYVHPLVRFDSTF